MRADEPAVLCQIDELQINGVGEQRLPRAQCQRRKLHPDLIEQSRLGELTS